MKLRDRFRLLLMATSPWMAGLSADGSVIEFSNQTEWEAAVGRFTTIDFTGFPEATNITNQYEDLGITFTDGIDLIRLNNNTFPNDGAGLDGLANGIEVSFDTPQLWIAVEYPGDVRFELFSEGGLIFTSTDNFPGGGAGFFAGLLSTQPFDAVIISDPTDSFISIDDLHFGVPAPPTLALLALATLFGARRRPRHGCEATTSPR